mmetsp:Transcript_29/g.68  ORF Transcript_29/g.68 Transcript_29/m.68 type:complete len:282 (-) Transcript_29:2338-3183(-)
MQRGQELGRQKEALRASRYAGLLHELLEHQALVRWVHALVNFIDHPKRARRELLQGNQVNDCRDTSLPPALDGRSQDLQVILVVEFHVYFQPVLVVPLPRGLQPHLPHEAQVRKQAGELLVHPFDHVLERIEPSLLLFAEISLKVVVVLFVREQGRLHLVNRLGDLFVLLKDVRIRYRKRVDLGLQLDDDLLQLLFLARILVELRPGFIRQLLRCLRLFLGLLKLRPVKLKQRLDLVDSQCCHVRLLLVVPQGDAVGHDVFLGDFLLHVQRDAGKVLVREY